MINFAKIITIYDSVSSNSLLIISKDDFSFLVKADKDISSFLKEKSIEKERNKCLSLTTGIAIVYLHCKISDLIKRISKLMPNYLDSIHDDRID